MIALLQPVLEAGMHNFMQSEPSPHFSRAAENRTAGLLVAPASWPAVLRASRPSESSSGVEFCAFAPFVRNAT